MRVTRRSRHAAQQRLAVSSPGRVAHRRLYALSPKGPVMLILHTKMIPPRRSRGVLPRPRLERLADAMGEHKVTIVKAPAGYGKSTLGRTWIEELGAAGARVGWLSADAADADPSRLAV